MGYQLEPDETIGAGVIRILQEQSDQAVGSLQNVDTDPNEAIHEARKCFKRIRAALRLVRDEVGEDVYKRENVCYRDAGRALAAVRDSYVKVTSVDVLVDRYGDGLGDAFQETRRRLLGVHHALRQRIFAENVPAQVAATLVQARPRIAALPIDRGDFGAVRGGIHRVYRRGYWGLGTAYAEPVPENFHEWRKRVKYLWYHACILNPLWPGPFAEWANQLDLLGNHLGEAHDMAVLHASIAAEPSLCPDDGERERLLALAARCRAALEAAARPLGRRLYTETPEAFVQRMAGYWQAWQADKALRA